MIYGDNPQKINEREDALGLKHYSYAPELLSVIQSGNLYVYTANNPLLYIDSSGEVLNAIVGGIIGGISSLMNGENFWAGAAEGAVSGAIAGAAVDLALATVATGGIAGIVFAGTIAFSGGMIGSMAGQQASSLVANKTLCKIDMREAFLDGFINTIAFGASGLVKYANKGIIDFNHSKKLTNIFKDAFGNPLKFEPIDVVSIDSTIKVSAIRSLLAEMLRGSMHGK